MHATAASRPLAMGLAISGGPHLSTDPVRRAEVPETRV